MKQLFTLFLCAFSCFTLFSQETDFYDTDKIQSIELTFEENNWKAFLDSLHVNNDKTMLLAKANINGTVYDSVGVRYRGSRSFATGSPRNPLYIKLNYIKKDQHHTGIQKIKLSNALRDPSMVREVLGYEIARTYMPAPRANYAKITTNDTYYGLFINVEAIDETFLQSHFNNKEGTFIKCAPDLNQKNQKACKNKVYASLIKETDDICYKNNYDLESKTGWEDLENLIETLNDSPKNIERILNVDRTLWMLAFNNVLVNLSSYSGRYSQNYYLYKDTLTGQFTPIIWDLNLAFGTFKQAEEGSDYKLKQLQQLSPMLHSDNPNKPLISQLLKQPYYKKLYRSHLRTILDEQFRSGRYIERAKELQQLIQVDFSNDHGNTYSINDFNASLNSTVGTKSKVPGIMELMEKRRKVLIQDPSLNFIAPDIRNVGFEKRKTYSAVPLNEFAFKVQVTKYPKTVKVFYRFDATAEFESVTMKDDGKHHDNKAGDGIFGMTVKAPNGYDEIHYYIYAENPSAISFSPSNYMFEQYSKTLEEINQ